MSFKKPLPPMASNTPTASGGPRSPTASVSSATGVSRGPPQSQRPHHYHFSGTALEGKTRLPQRLQSLVESVGTALAATQVSSGSNERLSTTIKNFTAVDTLSTSTRQSLERVHQSLDRMDDQLAQLTATVKFPPTLPSTSGGMLASDQPEPAAGMSQPPPTK